jgi:alkaline phosphatase D
MGLNYERSATSVYVTGDVVYVNADSEKTMRQSYQEQLENAGYSRLVEDPLVEVIGTWDDNDYGSNNGGAEYSKKELSQQIFLDFLGEPPGLNRRLQQGIYSVHDYGPADQLVRVILLDDRFHKQKVGSSKSADLLGEAQWSWLESQLRQSSAKVHIIVSGIQILSQEHPYESWGQYPASRRRLLNLIKTHKPSGTLLISGDRHIAEISRLNLGSETEPWWLYDITSSGMTHSYEDHPGEPNSLRVGPLFSQLNYGRLKFDWSRRRPKVTADVVSVDGKVVLSADVVK